MSVSGECPSRSNLVDDAYRVWYVVNRQTALIIVVYSKRMHCVCKWRECPSRSNLVDDAYRVCYVVNRQTALIIVVYSKRMHCVCKWRECPSRSNLVDDAYRVWYVVNRQTALIIVVYSKRMHCVCKWRECPSRSNLVDDAYRVWYVVNRQTALIIVVYSKRMHCVCKWRECPSRSNLVDDAYRVWYVVNRQTALIIVVYSKRMHCVCKWRECPSRSNLGSYFTFRKSDGTSDKIISREDWYHHQLYIKWVLHKNLFWLFLNRQSYFSRRWQSIPSDTVTDILFTHFRVILVFISGHPTVTAAIAKQHDHWTYAKAPQSMVKMFTQLLLATMDKQICLLLQQSLHDEQVCSRLWH